MQGVNSENLEFLRILNTIKFTVHIRSQRTRDNLFYIYFQNKIFEVN
jgi:hypothetical protein